MLRPRAEPRKPRGVIHKLQYTPIVPYHFIGHWQPLELPQIDTGRKVLRLAQQVRKLL
jgi:hypothetical protein